MVESLSAGMAEALALPIAWDQDFAPGMAQVTASNIRIQRSANCAIVTFSGISGQMRSTAWSPV